MHSIHVKIEEPYSVSDKNVIAQINNPEVLIELIVAQIRWFLLETLNMSCTKQRDITLSFHPPPDNYGSGPESHSIYISLKCSEQEASLTFGFGALYILPMFHYTERNQAPCQPWGHVKYNVRLKI